MCPNALDVHPEDVYIQTQLEEVLLPILAIFSNIFCKCLHTLDTYINLSSQRNYKKIVTMHVYFPFLTDIYTDISHYLQSNVFTFSDNLTRTLDGWKTRKHQIPGLFTLKTTFCK